MSSRTSESTVEVYIPEPHDAQVEVLDGSARFTVVACGRRWGKTTLGIREVVAAAVVDAQPAAWFSPTYKMLLEVWREARRILRPVTTRVSQQERRIEVVTGGVVEFWSLDNPDVARGRQYGRAVVDEAAMIPDLWDTWNAVIRPTLMDRGGDAWFLSTPRGREGFHRLFQLGQDESEKEWASFRMPTSRNPYIPAEEVAAARRSMPERVYSQEIMADFIENSGAVFRRVMDAATAEETGPEPGHQYVIGADWARDVDFTAFAVVDVDTQSMVHMHRSNDVDYTIQAGRLRGLAERYNGATVIAESNAMGLPIIEQLARDGVAVQPWKATNATKGAAVESLALAFERGLVRVLDNPTLIDELQSFGYSRTPTGLIRYEAASGGHDDCVIALMLAWLGAASVVTGEVLAA